MLAHNGHEYRQSGVPGIVIFGKSSYRNFALYVHVKGRYVLVTHRDVNEFPTVRDAKAAARRIADLLPWDSPDLYDVAQAERAATELLVRTALAKPRKPGAIIMDFIYKIPEGRPDANPAYHMLGESLGRQEYLTACGRKLQGEGLHRGISAYPEDVDCLRCRRSRAYREYTGGVRS